MNHSNPKIALIGPVYPFRGGIAHYNSHLARHLTETGTLVKVFSFKRQYPKWLYPGETDRDPSLHPLQVEAEYLLDPVYPWTWWKCARHILDFRPDLVILPWWTTFWAPAFGMLIRLLRQRIPVVYLIHNVIPHEAKPWDKALGRFALNPADHFIVQTGEQQQKLVDLIPGAAGKISLCPHPIYDLFSNQRVLQLTARKEIEIPQEGPVLLFFGIVRPYKGLHLLLDAMGRLNQTGDAPFLIIAGEFWDPIEEYQVQIERLGLINRIKIIPGYQPDEKLPLYFSAADLLVAPYIGGTQSGVVKLAIGFGLPVLISSNISDTLLNKLVGNGVWIFPSLQPEELAETIREVCDRLNRLHQPGKVTDTGWQDLADKIFRLIR